MSMIARRGNRVAAALAAVALLFAGSLAIANPTARLDRLVNVLVVIALLVALWVLRRDQILRDAARDANERAEASAELYRRSFEDASSGLVVGSLDGRVLHANQAFCDLTGYPREDLVALTFADITHPDDRMADIEMTRRLVAGELSSAVREKRYIRADGTVIWVELHASAARAEDGTPINTTAQVHDISARKRAQEEARISRRRISALVDNLPDMTVATYDLDMRCDYIGGGLMESSAFSVDDVLGKTLWETLDKASADQWAARMRAALAGVPIKFHHASAADRELEVQIVPMAGEGVEVDSVMVVTRNVTERRRADEALRESQERLQAILDYAPAVIYLKDAEGRFVLGNHGLEDLMGVSFEQIRGQTDADLFDETTAAQLRDQDCQVRETELPLAGEYELAFGDQTRTYFDVKFPIFDSRGNVTGVCAIATDITARKNAEIALRISEQRHRSVVEALDEGVLLYDSRGVVIACNQNAAELVGIATEEIVGRSAAELPFVLVDEKGKELAREDRPGYRAILTGEPQLNLVAGHPRPDGDIRWLSINAMPIADDAGTGSPYAVAVSFADITERRRAERLKDEFFALVSHELRTPLTSIAGYLELLTDDDAEGELDSIQRQFLGVVERNARRLQRLVGDLLFVAQFEAGKLSLDMGRVRIADVASEAIESAGPRAADLGLDLQLHVDDVPEITGDAGRLGQSVDNLVSNALKFTPSGGKVEVRVIDAGDHARIEVADTGIGIAREEQKRLFERFFRTAVATEQAIPGVGLGLSITKAIIEGHGGSISVASDEGRGTTFTIELPYAGRPRGDRVPHGDAAVRRSA
jgi:PAS domain S-box-containing protein